MCALELKLQPDFSTGNEKGSHIRYRCTTVFCFVHLENVEVGFDRFIFEEKKTKHSSVASVSSPLRSGCFLGLKQR